MIYRYDGVYAVPANNTWPECDIKTTTAKPRNNHNIYISYKVAVLRINIMIYFYLQLDLS